MLFLALNAHRRGRMLIITGLAWAIKIFGVGLRLLLGENSEASGKSGLVPLFLFPPSICNV